MIQFRQMECAVGYGDVRESGDKRVRCLVVVGTRPEAIKMFPVVHALRRSPRIQPFVVFTGQHADMVRPIFELAGVDIDVDLGAGRPGESVNQLVASVVAAFDDMLSQMRGGPERRKRPRLFAAAEHPGLPYPAATLVHGDTTSAMAAGLASAGAMLPVVHVESGLRTGDILSPFPEEMNRQVISRLASFHLAPTERNLRNLVYEGVDPRRIFVTGNTSLDALQFAAELDTPWPDPRLDVLDDPLRPLIAVTAHRRENWGTGVQGIAEGVARIARARPDVLIVLPMHPNPAVRADLVPALEMLPNVLLTEPMDYAPFARLLRRSMLAITDSGGIQEEGPSVGTPVLVTRETSERQEGVEAGTLRLVGTDPDAIAGTALQLLSDPASYLSMRESHNPYGDGRAAVRIAEAMEHLIFGGPVPLPFGATFSRLQVLEAAGYSDAEIAETSKRISQADFAALQPGAQS